MSAIVSPVHSQVLSVAPKPESRKPPYKIIEERGGFGERKGGYLIRVQGLASDHFIGRVVPVHRRDETETHETLNRIIWTGKDEETGDTVSLYKFLPKPPDDEFARLDDPCGPFVAMHAFAVETIGEAAYFAPSVYEPAPLTIGAAP